MNQHSYDIIIIGGGIVGLTLSAALAKKSMLSIAVLESQAHFAPWTKDHYSHRVSAITLSSQRIFKALQVWDDIQEKRISPFTQIAVWDNSSQAELHFDCNEIAEPVLGFIIENNLIQAALLEKIKQHPQIQFISSAKLQGFQTKKEHIELLSDGETLQAKLIIAADGAHSWLRNEAGIAINKQSYDQEALVSTVKTTLPHQKIARQVFLKTGPLAFLPLADAKMCSIVWSLPHDEAKRLLGLEGDMFKTELAQAFSYRLGDIESIDERFAFPLARQQAESYVRPRIALVGDAAHTVHPLAGQGVNMGMLDAACLAEIILEACEKQRDFSSFTTLRRYERWRKADNFAMQTGIDMLKNLFESDKTVVQNFRAVGMNLTNKINWLKRIFVTHAVGDRAGLPKIAM